MSEQDRLVHDLKNENEQLRRKVDLLAAERDQLRKAVERLLPVENFEYDVSELEDLLVHPDKYQTLDEFLRELQANNHGR